MSALNWLLGGLSCALFLGLGASGINIPSEIWMMLYSDAAALQIGLYVWNRRHNVSPHEPQGSSGAAGMVMSALSAPIYAMSLVSAVLRRKSGFVVTPKGDSASPDRLATFRIHLFWAAVFAGSIAASFVLGHTHVAILTWASLALLMSLLPLLMWWGSLVAAKRDGRLDHPASAPAPAPAQVPAPVPASAADAATLIHQGERAVEVPSQPTAP